MIQDLLKHAFGVPQGYQCVRTDNQRDTIEFRLTVTDDQYVCPKCKSTHVISKGSRNRDLKTVPIGLKSVWLAVEVAKCLCKDCGAKFELPPLLPRPMSITPRDSQSM